MVFANGGGKEAICKFETISADVTVSNAMIHVHCAMRVLWFSNFFLMYSFTSIYIFRISFYKACFYL